MTAELEYLISGKMLKISYFVYLKLIFSIKMQTSFNNILSLLYTTSILI